MCVLHVPKDANSCRIPINIPLFLLAFVAATTKQQLTALGLYCRKNSKAARAQALLNRPMADFYSHAKTYYVYPCCVLYCIFYSVSIHKKCYKNAVYCCNMETSHFVNKNKNRTMNEYHVLELSEVFSENL